MPDGMSYRSRPDTIPDHQINADISSMTPAQLAHRFAFLNDEADRLGEIGDKNGEQAANDASFEAYEEALKRPIGSLEDAMATLIIAANRMYDAVAARWEREEAAPAWASLGRVASFLAEKEGLDPADYGARCAQCGIDGLPAGLRAGVWISRALRVGSRLLVSENGEVSLALPTRTADNAREVIEIEAEYSQLDRDFLHDVLMSDIDDTTNQPYRMDTPKVEGRAWLVSRARNGCSMMHAVELPRGAVE